jgi:hypothetical protein
MLHGRHLRNSFAYVPHWFKDLGHVNVIKINNVMTINEVTSIKPLTPQQQRIKSLKVQKDNVTKALKAERDRQKIAKAQQTIANVKLG